MGREGAPGSQVETLDHIDKLAERIRDFQKDGLVSPLELYAGNKEAGKTVTNSGGWQALGPETIVNAQGRLWDNIMGFEYVQRIREKGEHISTARTEGAKKALEALKIAKEAARRGDIKGYERVIAEFLVNDFSSTKEVMKSWQGVRDETKSRLDKTSSQIQELLRDGTVDGKKVPENFANYPLAWIENQIHWAERQVRDDQIEYAKKG